MTYRYRPGSGNASRSLEDAIGGRVVSDVEVQALGGVRATVGFIYRAHTDLQTPILFLRDPSEQWLDFVQSLKES